MNGEYISIESAKIMTDIEKENKELQNRVNKAIKKINILNENLCENTDLQLEFNKNKIFFRHRFICNRKFTS